MRPCPGCGDPLDAAPLDGVALEACARCGGLWLDNAATRVVCEAMLPREALSFASRLAAHARGVGGAGTFRDADRSSVTTRRCPACGQDLQERRVPWAGEVVDICPEHGTWFDRRELPSLHAAAERKRLGEAAEASRFVADLATPSEEHRRRGLLDLLIRLLR